MFPVSYKKVATYMVVAYFASIYHAALGRIDTQRARKKRYNSRVAFGVPMVMYGYATPRM
jgi:hypothetical protein